MITYKFIDLFSGIGGFRLGCEKNNGICVFSSEINKYSKEVYFKNFNDYPQDDITKILSKDIPDFDLLCAGFPCQPFSISGKREGFNNVRGTLIFDIARIVRDKKPKSFLLENVKGLLSHDNRNTFRVIKELFGKTYNRRKIFFPYKDNLRYNIFYKVINSSDFGLAQNRERIFIIGFREDIKGWNKFRFPIGKNKKSIIEDILEKGVNEKYYLKENQIKNLSNKKNRSNLYYCKIDPNKKMHTLTTHYGRIGAFGNGYLFKSLNKIRILTPRECARLQGFPDSFILDNNDRRSYEQLGNAVSPPVIDMIIKEILKILF